MNLAEGCSAKFCDGVPQRMARFCPGMTLHKPIRTDAGHATLQDLRQGWVGGWGVGYRADTSPLPSPSFRTGQTARDVSKLPTSHGDAEEKLRPCVCLPQAYALCMWTQAFHLSRHLVSSAFRPSLLWVTSTRLSTQENIPATQWRDTETLKLCLAPAPVPLNPYHHPYRNAGMVLPAFCSQHRP